MEKPNSNTTNNFFNSSKDSNTHSSPCQWETGAIINEYRSKKCIISKNPGLTHFDVEIIVIEVIPPLDIVQKMTQGGKGSQKKDGSPVAFFAELSIPIDSISFPIGIKLKSANGGIYAHETEFPKELICNKNNPIDTVRSSLNHALNFSRWYPAY